MKNNYNDTKRLLVGALEIIVQNNDMTKLSNKNLKIISKGFQKLAKGRISFKFLNDYAEEINEENLFFVK